MKKFIIFLIIVIIIISCITYIYLNQKANFNDAKFQNMKYENYLNKEVYGGQVASIINKAIDNNKKEQVSQDGNGIYQDNTSTSISVQIKFLDNDKIYEMENLYAGGIDNFINYYNHIKFKCTKIEYHKSTYKVRYILFEQITQ